MNAYSVVVNISINSSGAAAGVNNYNQVISQIQATAANVAKQSALSFDSIFGANFFAALAAKAVTAFTSGFASGFTAMTTFAARTEELGVALEGITKVNNLNANSVRNVEQSLKDANIATQTARQVLTQYIAAALPLEKATPLANVAKDLAVIAGVNSSEEFQRLIVGITTLNNRVLRTAGVFIQAKDAEKTYAQQIGTTAAHLTTEQKQLAVLNGVLEFGTRATGLYGLAMDTTAKQMRSLERIQQDFSDAVGGKFVPILGVAVKAYTLFLQVFTVSPASFIAATAGLGLFTAALIAMNTAQLASLPVIGTIISSVKLLGQVMIGSASLIQGAAATTIAATAGWVALAAVVAAAAVAIGSYIYQSQQFKPITDEQLTATVAHSRAIGVELNSLTGLSSGVALNASQQQALTKAYRELDPVARSRVDIIEQETERTKALVAERRNLQTADQLAIELEGTNRVKALSDAIKQNTDLTELRTQAQQFYNASTDPQVQEQNLQVFTRANAELTENQKRIASAAEALKTYSQITGLSTEQVISLAQSHGRLSVDAKLVREELDRLTSSQTSNTDGTTKQVDKIRELISQYRDLTDAMDKAKNRQSQITALSAQVADIFVEQGKPGAFSRPGDRVTRLSPTQILQQRLNARPELRNTIKDEQDYQKALKAVNDELDVKDKKDQKSEFKKLQDDVHKLNAEINSFTNLTSKEFKLRFQREDLERTKRDFETILNLRRDLDIPLAGPLPTTAPVLQEEIRSLNRLKDIKEAVQKATDEQKDAERDLSIAIKTQELPVVDAQTRAATAYARAVRELRNSDQQLTADVITASRLRQDRMRDETANTFRAYQNLRLELLKETEQLNTDLAKNKLFNRIVAGDEQGIQSEISNLINVKGIETPSELTTIAEKSTQIAADVATIAGRGSGVSPTGSALPAGGGSMVVPQTASGLVQIKLPGGETRWVRPGGVSNALTFNARGRSSGVTSFGPPGSVTTTAADEAPITSQTAVPGVSALELIREKFYKSALNAREQATKDANSRILANEALLKAGLIDFDIEIRAARSDTQLQRLHEVRQNAIEIKLAEDDIAKADAHDVEYVARLQQEARLSRVTEQKNLKDQIIILEDDIAHAAELSADRIALAYTQAKRAFSDVDDVLGRTKATVEFLENLKRNEPGAVRAETARQDQGASEAALSRYREIIDLQRKLFSNTPQDIATRAAEESDRYASAWLKAIDAVREADIQARESMIASQVRLADMTIYHADQANAKVLDFLAQQKSVTDIIGDAKIGVISSTYNFIDQGLDKITKKLGAVGSILKDLVSGFIKLALNRAFAALFGFGGNGATAGGAISTGGAGGGGFNLGSIFSNIFGGGGQVGGTAPIFGTNFGGGSFASRPQTSQFASLNPLGALSSLLGPSLTPPISVSTGTIGGIGGAGAGGIGAGAGGAIRTAGGLGGSLFSGLGGLASGLLASGPLIGLGLGSQLGGTSTSGKILGGLGGLLGGVAATGGLLTALAGTGIAAGAAGTLGVGLTAGILAAAPFAAIAAPILLYASYIIGRTKLRRQEEEQRTAILLDSKSKMQEVLTNIQGGKIDSATALAQANVIRQDYLNQVGQLKDKKTRNIAIATVRELDLMINDIKTAGTQSDLAAERFKLLVPTFATGGGINYVSGSSSREVLYITKRDDEAVITQQQMANLGGVGAMARAGVPGYSQFMSTPQTSLAARSVSFGNQTVGAPTNAPNQLFVLVGDDKAADDIVSRARPGTVAKKMKLHTRDTGLDGYAGDVFNAAFR